MNQNPESNCFLWLFGFSQWGLNTEGEKVEERGRGDLNCNKNHKIRLITSPPFGIDFREQKTLQFVLRTFINLRLT